MNKKGSKSGYSKPKAKPAVKKASYVKKGNK